MLISLGVKLRGFKGLLLLLLPAVAPNCKYYLSKAVDFNYAQRNSALGYEVGSYKTTTVIIICRGFSCSNAGLISKALRLSSQI